MAFCGKCGAQTQDGAKFCLSCAQTGQTRTNDVEANRLMAVLAYIGILIIVPLVKGGYKESPFLKFHMNQAIVFYIGYAASILISIIPVIGALVGGILSLGIAVLQIICIVTAFKGQTKSFPVISGIKIIKQCEYQ